MSAAAPESGVDIGFLRDVVEQGSETAHVTVSISLLENMNDGRMEPTQKLILPEQKNEGECHHAGQMKAAQRAIV